MKKLEIENLLGLTYENDRWESLNNDPQIYLKGPFKKGWYKLECVGSSDELRYLKLYVDYGQGFSEENSTIIGKIDRNNSDTRPFELKHDVVSMRLDPGDTMGVFTLQSMYIRKISSASIVLQAFNSYKQLNQDKDTNLFLKAIQKVKENGVRWVWDKAISLMVNRPDYQMGRYEPYSYVEEAKITNFEYSSKPLFTIIIPIYQINKEHLENCLSSIAEQSYQNYEVLLLVREQDPNSKALSQTNLSKSQSIITNQDNILGMLKAAEQRVNGDHIMVLEQEDFLSVNALHYFALSTTKNPDLIFTNEDRFMDNGDHFAPFHKEEYLTSDKLDSKIIGSFAVVKLSLFNASLKKSENYEQYKIYCSSNAKSFDHISKFTYHRRVADPTWPEAQNNKTDIVAFYLPQFHAIPENDEWWGKGFTEWTNVRKAVPLFKGHYQPHIPSAEGYGYYNLVEDEDIQKKQAQLAKEYGIAGFCYYYYWFDGKRLLEKPMNKMLENRDVDLPFCICWANESWSRRWDGQEKELLMEQVHNEDSDRRFIEDIIPVLKDERYIRINGNDPLLLIYRAELFPNLKATVQSWKEQCKREGIPNLHVSMVQSFGQVDPTVYGCDSAVEFPPHGIYANEISKTVPDLNPDFSGNIYDYTEVVDRSLQKRNSQDFVWFRGTMLSWDNTARRNVSANIFNFANPLEYEKWLVGVVDHTRRFNDEQHQVVFVNAWNEWAEGTHLEPDEKYGHQYLEVTKRASRVR